MQMRPITSYIAKVVVSFDHGHGHVILKEAWFSYSYYMQYINCVRKQVLELQCKERKELRAGLDVAIHTQERDRSTD